jgi:two-component system response regulator FlrC
VLVVDDQPAFRRLLVRVLVDDGYQVTEARDGREALELARKTPFHLVLSDIRMPGLDGVELLDKLQAEVPATLVVLLTAFGSVPAAVDAMKKGAFDYLTKPLADPDELRVVVARAMAHRRLVDAQEAMAPVDHDDEPVHAHATMVAVVAAARRVALVDATVLLTGESGTGKEVVARLIHARSSRAERPFVAVNCAALAEGLLDSELFGHERGAFTGADRQHRGRFEVADGGTLLLDEVGEMSPALQAKVLRVLQERTFERVGGTATLHVDVRVIVATHRDLHAEVARGRFREDLYYRLAVVPLHLPPLRDRGDDVLLLARHFLAMVSRRYGRAEPVLTPAARQALLAYPWPGNVRELANVVERAVVLSDDRPGHVLELAPQDLWLGPALAPAAGQRGSGADQPLNLHELERQAILRALDEAAGNRKQAAELLGIGLRTLQYKLNEYGLR